MANTKDSTSNAHPSASTSSKCQTLTTKATRHRKLTLFKLYKFIDSTYREIRKCVPALETTTNLNDTTIMGCINNYKKCFLEIYEKEDALEYFEVCGELAQNISRTLDLFKEIAVVQTNMDEYYHRVCELLSIFIACELRLSVDSDDDLSLIARRIIYIIKRHLTQEDEEATRNHILLTLVYIPRLFNARNIVCKIFEEFLPLKPHMEATALPDKIYILYIIVFYRWMSMKSQDEDKKYIIDMAEKFMKPMVSLCNNQLYIPYLPAYTTHRTATRTILCNLKSYQDLRTASIIDNAFKELGSIVNLCDDDDVIIIADSQETLCFSEIFAAVQLERTKAAANSIIKHETNTIIDSVDLTVDDGSDTTTDSCPIVMKYEKWLHNFQVQAKQFKDSQIRLKRQNENRADKVVCLDSDDISSSEEEEVVILPALTTSATKNLIKAKNSLNDTDAAAAPSRTQQQKSFSDDIQNEDLFADNYPLTVTPIHSNAGLDLSSVEDAEDVTKLSQRFLASPLRTYESSKKCTSSSRTTSRDSFQNTLENDYERTTNRPRPEKHIRFCSSPLGPTPAYSKKSVSLSQPTNKFAEYSGFHSFEGQRQRQRYPSCSSNVPSSAYERQEHITAASTLFRNIFDRSSSGSYGGLFPGNLSSKHLSSGDLFSTSTGRSAHSMLSPTGGFYEAQHRKRDKIHGLMQRRATLSCRSDFDNYLAALETTMGDTSYNDKFKMYPGHGPFNYQLPQSQTQDSVCSEVSNEPDMKPDPTASACSDYDITNRYQFQDEKLMKNCAVIIEPTPELIQYERKRDAMYNELLKKQRRKMELRAIEKMKEKDRRRQEKEQKRDKYLREQRETMEKLEKMKINSPFNENEMSDKESVTERPATTPDNSLAIEKTSEIEQQTEHRQKPPGDYHTDANRNVTSDIPSELFITPESGELHDERPTIPEDTTPKENQQNNIESESEKFNRNEYLTQTTDIESSDAEQVPLRDRMKKTRHTSQQTRSSSRQSTRIRKRRQSAVEALGNEKSVVLPLPIRTRRQSVVIPNYSEQYLASQNAGGRMPTTVTGLTDSETESVRTPSRNMREQRKSGCSNKLIEQTDSEIESEARTQVAANKVSRQTSQLQTVIETDDKNIATKLIPQSNRGRPRKLKVTNTKVSYEQKSEIIEELDVQETKNENESKENEATLSERTIVASIAERLYSPATIVVDKPLASAEQEEILETLEDLLGKETRLPKTVVAASYESCSISRGDSTNVNSSVKMVIRESENSPDLEVIENIVINEIQREMDANREHAKKRTPQASTFQNIISDLNGKSSINTTQQHENQRHFENTVQSPCEGVENVDKSPEQQHLQHMFNKTLDDVPSLSTAGETAVEPSSLPILISRVESLNENLERRKAQSPPIIECPHQSSILVTENILLSNGNEFLAASKTLDDNRMLPPLPSSLLSEVETSMIQADLTDISPTSINIVIPTDEEEEDTTITQNIAIDHVTTDVNLNRFEATNDNLSLANPNNEVVSIKINNQDVLGSTSNSDSKNINNAEENLLLLAVSNNEDEDETVMGSPPYEPLRVSSDDDADKQSTTTDDSQANLKPVSDSFLGGDCAHNDKHNTEMKSPPYEPLRLSSDDDEKGKSKVTSDSSSKLTVIISENRRIPFKTKASLKFPTTKKCKILLKRINPSHKNATTENDDTLCLAAEDEEFETTVPSPSLDQEDSIIRSENYNDFSRRSLASPEAVIYDDSLESDNNYRQHPIHEEVYHSVIVESYEEDAEPLPTILKSTSTSSSSPKPKSKLKTVTFSPVAEVIPISPNDHYDNRCIYERDETPPPEGFYIDHDYDRKRSSYQETIKFITPATRKHFSDDSYFSNISTTDELCNSSSSSAAQESDDDDHEENLGIVLASSKLQENMKRKNVELQRVLLVPPDAPSPSSKNSSAEHEILKAKNAEILNDTMSQEESIAPAAIQVNNDAKSAGNMSPSHHQLQCNDEARNVLVSTTFLTNLSSSRNHFVGSTIQHSMMSPSEHEVSSTQETIYQTSSNRSTNESDFSTSVAYAVSVREETSSVNSENCGLLQNNQVDTTNHSPDLCAPSSIPPHFSDNNFSDLSSTGIRKTLSDKHNVPPPHLSTSINEWSSKTNDILTSDINGGNMASSGICCRLSPSTTTDNSDNISENLQNSRLSRLKAKEPKKIQHNSSKLKHRNPFIVRSSGKCPKLSNASEQKDEKQSSELDGIKNMSKSNSCDVNNSEILSFVAKDTQKSDEICKVPAKLENCKMVSNNTSESESLLIAKSLITAKVESSPKKKVVLVRPKPYNVQKPATSTDKPVHLETTTTTTSILANNDEADSVKISASTKNKCVLIKPKPVESCQNPSTNVHEATNGSIYKEVMKKVKRNLNVIDFQEFSYSPTAGTETKTVQSLATKSEESLVLEKTTAKENLSQDDKDKKCCDKTLTLNTVKEDSLCSINKNDSAEINDLKSKRNFKENVHDDLLKSNLDKNCSENTQNESEPENIKNAKKSSSKPVIDDSKKELKRKHKQEKLDDTKRKSRESIDSRDDVKMKRTLKDQENKDKRKDRNEDKAKMVENFNHKETDDAKQEIKSKQKVDDVTKNKTAMENVKSDKATMMENPKQNDQTINKTENIKNMKQDKRSRQKSKECEEELKIKTKMTPRSDAADAKVEESNRDVPVSIMENAKRCKYQSDTTMTENPKQDGETKNKTENAKNCENQSDKATIIENPKQDGQIRNKTENAKNTKQDKRRKHKSKECKELNIKTKISPGNELEKSNKDKSDEVIPVSTTDEKTKDNNKKDKNDNPNVKELKRSANESDNTKEEYTKKAKLDILESKKSKSNSDDTKNKEKRKIVVETDTLKIDNKDKGADKRSHIHRDKKLRRKGAENEEHHKVEEQQDKSKIKASTEDRQDKSKIKESTEDRQDKSKIIESTEDRQDKCKIKASTEDQQQDKSKIKESAEDRQDKSEIKQSDKRRKRRHRLEMLDTNEIKKPMDISEFKKSKIRHDKRKDKDKVNTSTRAVAKVKNNLMAANININTRSNTIIAVKMIPFTGLTDEIIDLSDDDSVDVGTPTKPTKTYKNEIVSVKVIKDDGKPVQTETPNTTGQKSKHISHSIGSSIDETVKSPSLKSSATTSASTFTRSANASPKDTNLSSFNKKSITSESSNPVSKVGHPDTIILNSSSTSAATVHARKRHKSTM